jgi:hypothetical protein
MVSAVICCVEVIVTVVPSTGVADIVTVPVASVPAGFANNTLKLVNVYENPVVGVWKS